MDTLHLSKRPRAKPVRLLLAASLLLALTACLSSPPPPTQQMQAAQLAISSAEQERVADYAPQDLRHALDKLAAARVAIQQEDMELAARLAEESRVSAELATAITAQLKAKAINDEMQQNINALQREILRNSGTSQ
jgi:hypothetical protein